MHFNYSWGPVLSGCKDTQEKQYFMVEESNKALGMLYSPNIPNTAVSSMHKTVLLLSEFTLALRLSLLTCNTAVQPTPVLLAPTNTAMSPGLHHYTHLTTVSVQA